MSSLSRCITRQELTMETIETMEALGCRPGLQPRLVSLSRCISPGCFHAVTIATTSAAIAMTTAASARINGARHTAAAAIVSAGAAASD